VRSVIEIPLLSEERSSQAESVLKRTDNARPAGGRTRIHKPSRRLLLAAEAKNTWGHTPKPYGYVPALFQRKK